MGFVIPARRSAKHGPAGETSTCPAPRQQCTCRSVIICSLGVGGGKGRAIRYYDDLFFIVPKVCHSFVMQALECPIRKRVSAYYVALSAVHCWLKRIRFCFFFLFSTVCFVQPQGSACSKLAQPPSGLLSPSSVGGLRVCGSQVALQRPRRHVVQSEDREGIVLLSILLYDTAYNSIFILFFFFLFFPFVSIFPSFFPSFFPSVFICWFA